MLKPEEYLRPDVIGQIQRFDLKAKFILRGFLAGMHSSLNKGFSVEFSDHRPYIPGDEPRWIDWNVLARTERYYVKRFQADSALDTWLLLDTSASMGYHGQGATMSKWDYAGCTAAALAWLMLHQQDPVGLFLARSRALERLPAKSSRRHLYRLLALLSETEPAGEVDVPEAIMQAAVRLPHAGLLVVLSDFLAEPERIENAVALARHKGHDLIFFHVIDAAEKRLPFRGMRVFRDPETGIHVTTDADVVRGDYLQALEAHAAAIEDTCKRHRADYVSLDTATSFDRALTAFLHVRSHA